MVLDRPQPAMLAARASILVGTGVLVLKFVAYLLTGSVALLSDALESIINVVAAGGLLFALRVSFEPPDEEHPYGHTKAEYFSAIVEGVLILLAAFTIGREAFAKLGNPEPINEIGLGIGVSVVASAANLLLARYLMRLGTTVRSPAVVADGRHVMTDVITSVGVLVGVIVAGLTGWWLLDPLVAILVAVNILFTGSHLVRESVGGLMDERVGPADQAAIKLALREAMSGAMEAHDVRTRRAGRRTFVETHLVVPDTMTVREAHAIADRLEAAVRQRVPGTSLTVHVEPEGEAKGPRSSAEVLFPRKSAAQAHGKEPV
jgi:cation diffusion facilitator family transporter